MKRVVWDTTKVLIVFVACTVIFYFGMRVMHKEYDQLHRYDTPEGPAVKVFQSEDRFIDRLNLFFRLGE